MGPVVLVPGMGATDESMLALRSWLRRIGYDARPSKLGRIGGDVQDMVDRLNARVTKLAERAGRPVAMVGWSMGGVLSREIARDHPALIRCIVTFGSPAGGGPAQTVFARFYGEERLAEIAEAVEERQRTPLSVPVTAIWSRRDGIVAPAACIDRVTPGANNVEVSSSHIGLGLDPDVWLATAEALAATSV